VSRRESKSPVQIFQIDPENDGIESQRKELEAVFDEVASEVGPDVHPDRANSLGHVQQGNPNCSGLAHGARHDPRALNRLSRRSSGTSSKPQRTRELSAAGFTPEVISDWRTRYEKQRATNGFTIRTHSSCLKASAAANAAYGPGFKDLNEEQKYHV
jgi:hypothetical protein